MARKAKGPATLPARYQIRFAERVAVLPDRTRQRIKALQAARTEAMRRARNAVFYRDVSETEHSRTIWTNSVRELVAEARALTREVLRVR